MLQKPLLDRSCVVGIVQYLFNLLYYVIWWLHPFQTSRHYRFLLNVWFIESSWPQTASRKTNFTCKELTFCTRTIVFIIIRRYFRGIVPFTLGIAKNPSLPILKGPTGDRTHEDFERSISICSYIFASPNEEKTESNEQSHDWPAEGLLGRPQRPGLLLDDCKYMY